MKGQRQPPRAPWTDWPPATRWLIGVGLLLSLAILLLHAATYRFLTDDAYISFRYARNLSDGHGLVFNPGFERVEGYSNFLWVVLLAGLDRLGLVPEKGALVLSLAATVALWATVVGFALRGARDARTAWVVLIPVFLMAATRGVAVWSTGGLETRWFEMLVVLGALRLVIETEARLRGGRTRPLSPWLFALATLTRPDGLLISGAACAAAALVLLRRVPLAGYLRGWLPFVLMVGGHVLFRRLYYQAWFPNTYYAKLDGRTGWGTGFDYLGAFALEYAAYLWIPLLAAAVVAHRARRTLFLPVLFGSMILPHALYVAAIGGDHFEFRPLDLYFPLLFLLLGDGLRHALRRPRLARLALANLALILVGLWWLPWQSHRQFPPHYRSGFPGRETSEEARAWLSPGRDPLQRLPGLRSIAAAHRGLLVSLSARYVGLRAEEHRLFLATVIPDGLRLRRLIARGLLPRDLHMAMGCVGAVPYYSDVRTLDLLGLTDATVAHQPFRGDQAMGHDKFATEVYVRERGVDLWALAGVHPFLPADSDRLTGMVMRAIVQDSPWYGADLGDGEVLVCTFPQGAERAATRMPRLAFQRLADSAFARPVLRRAVVAYRDSLRRHPADLEARMVLGDLHLFQGEFAAAAESYERVLLGGGESLQLRMNLAAAYGQGGRREQALRSLERALALARVAGERSVVASLEAQLAEIMGGPKGSPASLGEPDP